jgi:triacylglycerol esterase/lipase EstA (alpha/beta hydrolase family)
MASSRPRAGFRTGRSARARAATAALLALWCGAGIVVPLAGDARAGAATANPVLIVAGTLSPQFLLDPLAARLRADGSRVHTMTLPGAGLGDIAQASRAVADEVDAIRATTGAAKVDLVGHSQGGLENRYYLKFLGGASKVGTYVSLGTPHYGAAAANLATFLGFGNCFGVVACEQMAIGSSFLANLNAGDDTPGPLRYVSIYTIFDELVQPFTNARVGDGAVNVSVQSHCWWKTVGHVGLVYDRAVYGLVRSALRGGAISTNCVAA